MELLHYTEEHKQFRESLLSFCQSEIIPNVQKWERDGFNCDLAVVAAAVDPGVENPYQAVSLYLVEAGSPGYKKGEPLPESLR